MLNKIKSLFVQDKQIQITDESGKSSLISEKKWRKKELPKQLKLHWDDSKRLSDDIAFALKDGYASDILNATKRLIEIDILPERSYILRAIALIETGSLDEADNLICNYHEKFEKTSASLINHAKIFARKNDSETAEKLLLEGLEIDPNTDEGIRWYTSIHKERFGNEGYKKSLEEICKLKGSWKAYLWLGRFFLIEKDNESALKIYNHYFRIAEERDRALLMLSADLGQYGLLNDMIELVGVQYIVEKHDTRIGFNLIKAYKQLGMKNDESMLINQLRELNNNDVNTELNIYLR